jgi:hypothetical protein
VLDCISKLISQLFDAKFSLARTKCKDIRRPLSIEELREDLNETSFITVSVDASNNMHVNIVPVKVRYRSHLFVPARGERRIFRLDISPRRNFGNTRQ